MSHPDSTQNPAGMNENSPGPVRNERCPRYSAPRAHSPSPIGWERAGVRVCFPAHRLAIADPILPKDQCTIRTSEALGVRLSFLCLFWRFSFHHSLTHSPCTFAICHGCHLPFSQRPISPDFFPIPGPGSPLPNPLTGTIITSWTHVAPPTFRRSCQASALTI